MHSKGNYKQGERQPSEWGRILANETTNEGLISKLYKQFIQQNTRKKNNTHTSKSGQRPKQTFLQKRYTDGLETHEKMLNITGY